jgi:hypothetical protein
MSVDDPKLLFWIVVAMAALVAMWWFGWFGPVVDEFLKIQKYTLY